MQSLITQQGGDLNMLNQLMTSKLSKQQEIMAGSKRDNCNDNSVSREEIKNANNVSPEPTTILNARKQSLDILSRLKTIIEGDYADGSKLLDEIEAKITMCDYITSKEFMYLKTLLRDSNINISDEACVLLQHIETLGLYSCDGDRDFVLRLLHEFKLNATTITEDVAFPLLLCTIERSVSERKVFIGTQMKMLRQFLQLYDSKLMNLIEEKLHCLNLIPEPMLYQKTRLDSSQPEFHASNETLRNAVKQ